MCDICRLLEKDKITFREANDALYSGEIPLDTKHMIEVLDKIDKKQKEDESK